MVSFRRGLSVPWYKEQDMAYEITDECTACGTCKDSCPAEAIQEGKRLELI